MKPRIISGIKPSGRLHLGNYLGALKHFVELQDSNDYDCFFFIADLHSLAEDFDPKEKPAQIADLAVSFLAAGLDPQKSTLFIQSLIPEHSELAWILSTQTPMGELARMTQYKDKSESGGANAGLFTYPVLMAADILLRSGRGAGRRRSGSAFGAHANFGAQIQCAIRQHVHRTEREENGNAADYELG